MTEIARTPTAMQVFDVQDRQWRFGTTEDGVPYVVAADVAKSFDQRDADKVLRLLEDDEKGTQIVGTPGGPQQMKVIYEDGIWELIFRSTKPEAKAIKKRVKAILREIRETGQYSPVPQTYAQALRAAADAAEAKERAELEAAQAKEALAITAPKAERYDNLMNAEGLVGMRAIADMLDVHVTFLTRWLVAEGVFRKELSDGQKNARNMPRRGYQTSGHFEVRMESNGKVKYQVAYATSKGLDLILEKWDY